MQPQEYYKNPQIQQELFRLAQGREVQAWFGETRGRRPEYIGFLGDLQDLIKQGMTSLHISEEHWKDVTKLKPGLSKRELDENRKGWDCILDIDAKHFPYAKITARLLIEAIKFHNISCYDYKFSGNNGIHIAIPFAAFPQEVNNIQIKDFFPDGVRIIANYLKSMIKQHLQAELLKKESPETIAKNAKKELKDIVNNGMFDPFKVVDIDSVLISNRHLFRCAYSINEKSGFVSIPLESLDNFEREDAAPEKVKVIRPFINKSVPPNEAAELLIQALDWHAKQQPRFQEVKEEKNYSTEMPKKPLAEELFPPCMQLIKKGIPDDGRKRAVFLYVNFLINCGWDYAKIQEELNEWNKKNHEQLKEGYIQAQISWFKKQKIVIAPPNCANDMYYKGIGVCKPDGLCAKIKNPVQYVKRKEFLQQMNNKPKTKRERAQEEHE